MARPRIQFVNTDERLTRKAGLVLINQLGDRLHVAAKIDRAFRAPGSNRGKHASDYVLPLAEMIIDGAVCLEDIRLFQEDEAYQELVEVRGYPSSDAIGDWLRRHGEDGGEQRLWRVIGEMIETLTRDANLTLDLDTTVIEAPKGDGVVSYTGVRGYNPLLAYSPELDLFLGSRFQPGNASPQADLVPMIHQCAARLPHRITTIRMDSAGYQRDVLNDCLANRRCFVITADHDTAVMRAVHGIPADAWRRGVDRDGVTTEYDVAETVHVMEGVPAPFRLVVKRYRREGQEDLFDGRYGYWIIATNIPATEKHAQAVLHFHQHRGVMEKKIGELKHHFSMEHVPCGQIAANGLYFTIAIFAYTLVQLLKRHYFGSDWRRKTVRSLRYHWLHVPARIVMHARYVVVKVAMGVERFARFSTAHAMLRYAPTPG